ncbi:helix-turn-helix domain-containing protein [Pedobacter montanisoli]|uniref:Helix-turn-helix domain-containing protein n=1 Tax=Pedobacter montanisoli TaxID=2923277 RepID=A0ABS9ZYZ8_9SPHI|nr:helix-turn-helix domain-containing protein [Pedobacter montanisoli]MCJ0743546.1 helix-turn-helix domain-containing protein [Pedobacter montanisoli]
MELFKTFKPQNSLLQKYVSYYYIDIASKPEYYNEYTCYPHYNSTVSIYKNHSCTLLKNHSIIEYDHHAQPLQIFTPLRDDILSVTQKGPVYKIAIVFEPFGINQFITNPCLTDRKVSPDFRLFSAQEIDVLLRETNEEKLVALLDHYLLAKFNEITHPYITYALKAFHDSEGECLIDDLAEKKIGISRKQFNRLFKQYIGVSPQTYRSIVRFRKLMHYKLYQDKLQNYTMLSAEAHYADQSHFIKSCKKLTGLTPSQFFNKGKLIGSEDTFWSFKS